MSSEQLSSNPFSLIWDFYGFSGYFGSLFLRLLPFLALALLAFVVWRFYLRSRMGKLAAARELLLLGERDDYHCYRNLSPRGGAGRIDFMLFSPFGIFVIDIRGESGLVIGGEGDDRWKQMGGKSKKSRFFQNPLRQNRNNAEVLRGITGLPGHCFHPVVVFADDVIFQSPMPHNIISLRNLQSFIIARKEKVLSGDKITNAIIAATGRKPKEPGLMVKLRKWIEQR